MIHLSAEQFQAIIAALRVPGASGSEIPAGGGLRVRRVRLGGRAMVIPLPATPDGAVEATALDVSTTGIGLTVPIRLVRGQQFILRVARRPDAPADQPAPPVLLCTAARYQPDTSGTFRLGSTFNRVLRD